MGAITSAVVSPPAGGPGGAPPPAAAAVTALIGARRITYTCRSASSVKPSARASASARRSGRLRLNTPPFRTAPMTEIRWLLCSCRNTDTWGSCMNFRWSRERISSSSSAVVRPVAWICPMRGSEMMPRPGTRSRIFDSSSTSKTEISSRSPVPTGRSLSSLDRAACSISRELSAAALPAPASLGGRAGSGARSARVAAPAGVPASRSSAPSSEPLSERAPPQAVSVIAIRTRHYIARVAHRWPSEERMVTRGSRTVN